MPGWVIPAISAIGSSVQSYLASRKQKRGYEMSPYEQMIFDKLEAQIGNVPGHVTAPFIQSKKRIKHGFSRQKGASGLQHGIIKRQVDIPMAEATGAYEQKILAQMASLAKGTGTQWGQEPMDIGAPLEDLGGMLYHLLKGKKKGKQTGGEGSYGNTPVEYLFGHRPRNVQEPRGYW